jgi:hypothetical protein
VWYASPLTAGAAFIVDNAVEFVTSQGRMKYTRPLYRELYKSRMGRDRVGEGSSLAREPSRYG